MIRNCCRFLKIKCLIISDHGFADVTLLWSEIAHEIEKNVPIFEYK